MIAEGEVVQLADRRTTPTTTEAQYLEVISGKTAALFAAASRIGAVVAERAGRRRSAALEDYGRNLGIAFQLVDDAIDYARRAGDAWARRSGDDFREGKITLPVILAYRRGDDAERVLLATDDRESAAAGRRRSRDGDAPDGPSRCAGLLDPPRRSVWRACARGAEHLPRLRRAPRTSRHHRFLHRTGALTASPLTDPVAFLRSLIEGGLRTADDTLNEMTIRLAVTGLSRAGKTVFIVSMIANLLAMGRRLDTLPALARRIGDAGRLREVALAPSGSIHAAAFRPHPEARPPCRPRACLA